jgi:hypothetical protein
MEFHTETKGLEKLFIYGTFAFRTLRDKRTVLKPKRILSRLNNDWQEFYLKKCTVRRADASPAAVCSRFLPAKLFARFGDRELAFSTVRRQPSVVKLALTSGVSRFHGNGFPETTNQAG